MTIRSVRPAPAPRSYGAATDRALGLWVALARCAASVHRVSARDIQRHGLTQPQFAVLEVLHHKGPLPLCAIGEKLLVTSGNVTYVADQLEKAGYLRRERSVSDRRVIHARLTARGAALLVRIFPDHAAVIARAAAALAPGEQATLARLLKKWGHAVQAGEA
jgi:MarR family transcriptional regulator, 2-MHQ and catechol-resistance regulon repressor